MGHWVIGYPTGFEHPAAPEPDENDWCHACGWHWTACVCADAVTPLPGEL